MSDFGLAKSFNTEQDTIINKFVEKSATLKDEDVQALKTKQDRRAFREKMSDRSLMFSTVGTPDYIAPEVFSQKG